MSDPRPGGGGIPPKSSRTDEDRSCYRCGAVDELVPDENVDGVWICRPCLARVEAQDELIRRGIEDEPDVEL